MFKDLFKRHANKPDRATSSYMDSLRKRRDAEGAMVVVQRKKGVVTGTLIWLDGAEEWFDGDQKLHSRGDDPAIKRTDGTRMWFKKGLLHRDGGPAIVRPDGSSEWWTNGEPVKTPKDAAHVEPPKPTPQKQALDELVEAATNGTSGRVSISPPLKLKSQKPAV